MALDPVTAPHESPTPPEAWAAESVQQVADRAQRWLDSDPLRELVHRLDGPRRASADCHSLLRWSSAALDTRGGAERREATPVAWSEHWIEALLEAAAPLGLTFTPAPVHNRYDTALVLGGATTGNRLRISMARELIDSGVQFSQLVALGADRPLSVREHQSEPASVQDENEWHNLLRYAAEAFGPLESIKRRSGGSGTGGWREELYRSSAGVAVLLLVAPPSHHDRRATTADAIDFFVRRVSSELRRSALTITSAIYAPYQFFATAPLLLKAGAARAELVGTPSSADGPDQLRAQRIAQETHAAIETACRLLTA